MDKLTEPFNTFYTDTDKTDWALSDTGDGWMLFTRVYENWVTVTHIPDEAIAEMPLSALVVRGKKND